MKNREFHEYVAASEKNISQIVCIKDGQEIYSDTWNDHQEYDAVHVMLATKSMAVLLMLLCPGPGENRPAGSEWGHVSSRRTGYSW